MIYISIYPPLQLWYGNDTFLNYTSWSWQTFLDNLGVSVWVCVGHWLHLLHSSDMNVWGPGYVYC